MDIISASKNDDTIAWYENTMDPVTTSGCDSDDNNPNVCNDNDGDTCDDCSNGSYNVANDGFDYDGDGACDAGDSDDDNDGAADVLDTDDNNEFVCSDDDSDSCDDCSDGSYGLADDGLDNDSDGWCNAGDNWPDCPNDVIDSNPYDECANCHGDGFAALCVGTDDCDDMACDGDCDQVAYVDACYVCDDSPNTDCTNISIDLDDGPNLISFYALPENVSVETIFSGSLGVLAEGAAAFNDNGTWIGSLEEVSQNDGYWVLTTAGYTLTIFGADPTSYDADGEVVYNVHYGPNLISYPFETPQYIEDALGDVAVNVDAILGEGLASINTPNGWNGSLMVFDGNNGYWMLSGDDFTFSFNGVEEGLFKVAEQPALRAVPEAYSFSQSTHQAFYFAQSATIKGEPLEEDDIIIAYNGDVVVGSRYWNGEFTDVPAMGFDIYIGNDEFCKTGDMVTFKVFDASSHELINMEADIETIWNNLNISIINLTAVLPDAFSLSQAYPNPFNPVTSLSFALSTDSEVKLSIYNLQGREVASLINGNMKPGYYSAQWDANNHSSGIYFVKMIAGEYINTQKLMLVK